MYGNIIICNCQYICILFCIFLTNEKAFAWLHHLTCIWNFLANMFHCIKVHLYNRIRTCIWHLELTTFSDKHQRSHRKQVWRVGADVTLRSSAGWTICRALWGVNQTDDRLAVNVHYIGLTGRKLESLQAEASLVGRWWKKMYKVDLRAPKWKTKAVQFITESSKVS